MTTKTVSPYGLNTIAVCGNVIGFCGAPNDTTTVANMPGRSLPPGFRTEARTWTLRVAGSTLGSKAETDAGEGRALERVRHHRHLAADLERAQLLLRHLEIDIDGIELLQRDDGLAAFTYWPTSTWRIPTRPL